MLRNYLKITLRDLKKNRWFTFINIIGLTIGISASLIVYVYVSHELSYDSFHKDVDRLYRVVSTSFSSNDTEYEDSTPYPLIGALNSEFSQFEACTQMHLDPSPLAVVNDQKSLIDLVIFADSNFFDVFSFKIISGDPKRAFGAPGRAFISERQSLALFGDGDPLGQKIKLRNLIEVEVEGVFENPPTNSHIRPDLLVSYPSFSDKYVYGLDIDSWTMRASGYAYVKLKRGEKPSNTSASFEKMVKQYLDKDDGRNLTFQLQPLEEIHFDRKWNNSATDETSLWILGVIGIFILFIGCVNFINLSTALAVRKSKEVGIRKSLGAGRAQLVIQYLSDTLIITTISGILAVGISERIVPLFNRFFDEQLELNMVDTLLFTVFIIIVVTLLAGIYPAFILSGFNPTKALKNNIHSQSQSSLFLRKGLIILQFFISQALVIATIVIANQMGYFMSKPLGFDREAVVTLDISENDEEILKRFRERLLTSEGIEEVSFSFSSPEKENFIETHFYQTKDGVDTRSGVYIQAADYHFKDTYGLNIKHGRWFLPGEEKLVRIVFEGDDDQPKPDISYIINETAARKLGYSNPEDAVGARITTGIDELTAPVVGVVEDYHMGSLKQKIAPAILMHLPMFYFTANVKLASNRMSDGIDHLETTYEDVYPNNLFEYQFIDDSIEELYSTEQRTFALFKLFSALSIFISCLGLLGLISFVVSQRMKEVGIRKVLGAKVLGIVMLFSRDFIWLVLIAFVLSAPVAWYAMDYWLSSFAYQIDMEVWFFLLTIILSMAIAFVSVGYQAYRAAMVNPVDVLKDE
ncbi:FtsX-like permease family protein [Fulvivirga sp. M361]|uniref:ABC transporter permease n=1 Tax=Fulvivirga sp. M361 TaxID=2594266 RepID=UPI00117B9E65|nr:ABC transporter permease [Fulvivirga sp. M361]TRX57582.1 FtsX-like permease family protein [Fulvivirga sp. M361]